MGEAARLSLKALGKQDTYLLSEDPEDSLFNYKPKRHSNFRKYHRSRVISNDGTSTSWPFGKTLKVQYNPQNMGDLLSNMWLSVKMPALNSISSYQFTHIQLTKDHADISGVGPDLGTENTIFLQLDEQAILPPGFPGVWKPYDLETKGYGSSVSISKNGVYLAVGAPNESRIYIYVLFQNNWFFHSLIETPETPTFSSNSSGNTQMGINVSINNNGNKVVVGTWYYINSHPTDIELKLYIFSRNTGEYTWSHNITSYEKYLQNDSPGIPTSISMIGDGTKVAVGFSGQVYPPDLVPPGPFRPGEVESFPKPRVYVYDIDNTGVPTLFANFEGYSDYNVVSISDDGNYLVVGAKGVVRLYRYISNAWSNIEIVAPTGAGGDFGHAVAINSTATSIAVSDLVNVYLYDINGVFRNTITGLGTGTQTFGSSLAMNSTATRMIIGQSSVGAGEGEVATAYIYVYNNLAELWSLQGTRHGTTDLHGFVVDCDDLGDVFITGEPSSNVIDITDLTFTQGFNYADQLGRHIFKSITMRVDKLEVEKIYDDWCVIHDEIYLEMSEKVAYQMLINRNLDYDSSFENVGVAGFGSDLMIPIPFFFSRKYSSDNYSTNKPNRPYFPLCAIHKQKIEFEIEFHNQSFFTDSSVPISLDNFVIITEEISISPEERNYIVTQPQQLITDIVKKHPEEESEVGDNIIRINLVSNIPVKCFHWFLRNKHFEED